MDLANDSESLSAARENLRADCSRCAGLCCVAPAFVASADFAINKRAGQACPNLRVDSGCGIHRQLRQRGFSGCAVFDCYGAGQQVVQVSFGGADWRESPGTSASMFAVFTVMRQLHEVLWYLIDALTLLPKGPLYDEVVMARARSARLAAASPDELAAFDAAAHRQQVGALLERVSEQARAAVVGRMPDRKGADLIEAKLRGADLRGASLRGAYLIGADLQGADLTMVDLLGADLRAADVRAAKLHRTLFLTQPQLEAAHGDGSTSIPITLTRPVHWPTAP